MSLERTKYFRELRRCMIEHFDLDELQTLAYDLSVDWEELPGANFAGACLSSSDLSEADFSNAILRGANLRGANLHKAKLDDAPLRGASYDATTQWPRRFNLTSVGAIQEG
ncbi:MAG TPA: hypothetical protein DEP47_13240 [Chloroflexi bacterium]|nr:hypothetical protein [Chloroflexota bacterium]